MVQLLERLALPASQFDIYNPVNAEWAGFLVSTELQASMFESSAFLMTHRMLPKMLELNSVWDQLLFDRRVDFGEAITLGYIAAERPAFERELHFRSLLLVER